jgi:hypothetical protein
MALEAVMRRPVIVMLWAVLIMVGGAVPALSQGERNGRFTMSPAEGGGFVKLDTETGQMSLCQRKDGDWACRDMADPNRGLGSEIERLRGENQKLKAEIRQMEEILLGDKQNGGARPGGKGGEFKLPSEKDVDEAMDYAQRMLRKFRDKLKDLEADIPGKGTPL